MSDLMALAAVHWDACDKARRAVYLNTLQPRDTADFAELAFAEFDGPGQVALLGAIALRTPDLFRTLARLGEI